MNIPLQDPRFHRKQPRQLAPAIILSDVLAAVALVVLLATLIGIAAVMYQPIV